MGFDQQAAVQFGAHVAPAVQRGEDGFHRARVLDVNVKALWHSFVRGSNPVSVAGWGAASGEGITAMTELFAGLTLSQGLGQLSGLVALGFCIAGFANKNDDRLMVLLISANVAFALMFAFFQSWTAAALTVLVILRIALARRYQGNWLIMVAMLVVNLLVAWATWKTATDVFPLTAATLGTVGMFMLRGIPLRIVLGLAALAWMRSEERRVGKECG